MMEDSSNISSISSDTLEKQIITYNECKVPDLTSVSEAQQDLLNGVLKNRLTLDISHTQGFINEMPSDYEDTNVENSENNFTRAIHSPDAEFASLGTLSPTIFENAVKVVKNLFSPTTNHGIFSRGIPQSVNCDPQLKYKFDEDRSVFNSGASQFGQKVSLTLSSSVKNIGLDREDIINTVDNSASNMSDTHNVTNESYSSTVSRMDESFQSTVTHIDDCGQNELDKIRNESLSGNTFSLNGSLNDTADPNDCTLNNTTKNISICSVENEDLNNTYEVINQNTIINDNMENGSCTTSDLDQFNYPEPKDSKNIIPLEYSIEKKCEEGTSVYSMDENSTPFNTIGVNLECDEGEHNSKMINSTGIPNKQCTIENFIASDKGVELTRMGPYESIQNCAGNGHDRSRLDIETVEATLSMLNKSPETDDSQILRKTGNTVMEKMETLRSSPELKETFSTSTVIITREESDGRYSNDTTVLCELHKPLERTSEPHMPECSTASVVGKIDTVPVKNVCLNNNNNSSEILKTINHSSGEVSENLAVSPKPGSREAFQSVVKEGLCDNSDELLSFKSEQFGNVSNSSLDQRTLVTVFSSDKDMHVNLETCSVEGIPLASQKSYTVLHNLNPDLNRPIVLDSECDFEAKKLGDIILGDSAFSELDVTYEEDCNRNKLNGISESSSHDLILNRPCEQPVPVDSNANQGDIDSVTKPNFENNLEDILNIKNENLNLHNSTSCNNLPESSPFYNNCSSEYKLGVNIESDLTEHVDHSSPIMLNYDVNYGTQSNSDSQNHVSEGQHSPNIETQLNSVPGFLSLLDKNKIFVKENYLEEDERNDKTTLQKVKSACEISERTDSSIEKNNSDEESSLKIVETGDSKEIAFTNVDLINETGFKAEKTEELMSAPADTSNDKIAMECLISDLARLKMNDDSIKDDVKVEPSCSSGIKNSSQDSCGKENDYLIVGNEGSAYESTKVKFLSCETDLTQLIEEQFTATDIEKICSVVDDIPELNLSKNIVFASQLFEKSFQGKLPLENENETKSSNDVIKDDNDLDFLDSIKGKPSGRDYSRESLYIKFDPLVQSKRSDELFDICEGDKENQIITSQLNSNITSEQLIPITPIKQVINNPLSPLSPSLQKNTSMFNAEKLSKLVELQNEISKLREFYLQREEANKEKMIKYEDEIVKLTGKTCLLEERLRESQKMEKSLVRKLNEQNESVNLLNNIIKEYLAHIGNLTDRIETLRMESQKEIAMLKEERDYFMNHLQSTEQAFSDVHSKYEKCKKAVEIYKKNEEKYKTNIDYLNERIENYAKKIKEIEENATREMNRMCEKINDMKFSHSQEISRFKAQLRKTELKVQTMQECLDQKIKENEELVGICDELIDGKKGSR